MSENEVQFKRGDKVRIRGVENSPVMTVVNDLGENVTPRFTVWWFGTTGAFHEGDFGARAMEKVSPDEETR